MRRIPARPQLRLHVALAGAELPAAADRSRRTVETAGRRESGAADPRPARRDGRAAVFPAVDDESAGAVVVRATISRAQSVPLVRPVEPRFDAGARRLSVRARALGHDAHAVVRVVGRLRRCSCSLCAACAWYGSRAFRAALADSAGTGRRREDRARRGAAPGRQLLWGALAATGSFLLLAVTNHICENISSIPLLWIVPLSHLPAELHSLLRRLALVPARPRCREPGGRPGRHGLDAGRSRADAQARAADRRLLHRAVRCLHVLPRRTGAAQARAALPDAVLPDGVRRRRASARRWWAWSRRWCCRPISSFAFGLFACAALLAFQMRRDHPVFITLGARGNAVHARRRRHGASTTSMTARSWRRGTSTASCACRRTARAQPAIAR